MQMRNVLRGVCTFGVHSSLPRRSGEQSSSTFRSTHLKGDIAGLLPVACSGEREPQGKRRFAHSWSSGEH